MSDAINDIRKPNTRTEAIAKAILEELRRRRVLIDENAALSELTVTVFLHDGPDMVRSKRVEEHSRHYWRKRNALIRQGS